MPPSKCDHRKDGGSEVWTTEVPGFSRWQSRCTVCMSSGPLAESYTEALNAFWNEVREEKQMSNDYDKGYKQGVLDATEPLEQENTYVWRNDRGVNELLSDRRKKLLTKKVTKWVAVLAGDEVYLCPDSKFYPSKEVADSAFDGVAKYRGAYPIEIEVEL